MNTVILIGAGGHGKVVADLVRLNGDIIFGYLDDTPHSDTLGSLYLGKVADYEAYINKAKFIITIGDNFTREKIVQQMNMKYKIQWASYVHPSAQIGIGVHIGAGSVVMANVVINASADIGKHCIVNTGAIIEHDNSLADCVHISPNATLGGSVVIGERTHIGIGAVVRNNINIISDCVIGAGAVVISDINEPNVYIGVPAKRKLGRKLPYV